MGFLMMSLRRDLVFALLIHENEVDKVIRQAKQLEDYINGIDSKQVLMENAVTAAFNNINIQQKNSNVQLDLPLGGE
jgi:hypothetical protein